MSRALVRAATAAVLSLALAPVLALAAAPSARAEDAAAIGFVKTVAGDSSIGHDGAVVPAHPGDAVHVADILQTGPDGALGITFKDNTRISLGPHSRVVVPSFTFAPADQKYGFVVRLVSGTLEYISGLTAKLSPQSMTIETPTSTIGVRGTRLLLRAEE